MIIVASARYFLSLGSYPGVKPIPQNTQEWFLEGDVIGLDRGYWDVNNILEECAVKTHSPHFNETYTHTYHDHLIYTETHIQLRCQVNYRGWLI